MSLPYTGERFIPGHGGVAIHLEHLHRYYMAARMVHGAVLDVGSGAGYGSSVLARNAERVVGIDIAPDSALFAATTYPKPNLRHTAGDVRAMPFCTSTFDWAVCFELIEHLQEGEAVLSEIARVLKPGGQLILSTPNRPIYTEASGITNPFHVREFDAAELRELLAPYFEEVVLFGQRLIAGSLAWVLEDGKTGSLLDPYKLPAELGAGLAYDEEPTYMLALCARRKGTLQADAIRDSLTAGRLETFFEEDAARAKEAEMGLRADYEAVVMEVCGQVQAADRQIRELGTKLEERAKQADTLQTELNAIHNSKMWRTWLKYHALRDAIRHPIQFLRRRRIRAVRPKRTESTAAGRAIATIPRAPVHLYLMLWAASAFARARLRRPGRFSAPASRLPGRRPRILLVAPYAVYPPNHGGGVRLYNLIRALSRDCDLHLLIFHRSEEEKEQQRVALEPYLRSIHFHHWQPQPRRSGWTLQPSFAMMFKTEEVQSLIHRILREENIDVLQLEYTELGQYGMARYDGVKTVLTLYDVSFRSYARRRRAGMLRRYGLNKGSGLWLTDWMRLLRYELRVARRADQVHVMSAADGGYLSRFLPSGAKTIRVIPNAVDLDHYTAPPPDSRPARRVLFVGNFEHMPNLDALDYLMQEIWPRVRKTVPDAELVIVGAKAGPSVYQYDGRDGVTVIGPVEETAPHYQNCTMLVAPIRAASGTRLKILEAFACETPVVTTTIGAEGIEGKAGEHFLIADDAAAFADAVCELLRNPALRVRLGRNGRELAERSYSWDASAAAALTAYAELTD